MVPTNGKKAKKAALKTTLDYGDKHALAMRAQRFQREHAIERTKAARIGGQDSPQTYSPHSHLFNRSTSTSSPYAGIDEPEGDPVCPFTKGSALADMQPQNVIDWDKFTIVGTSKEIFKDYLRLTSVSCLIFSLLSGSDASLGTQTRDDTSLQRTSDYLDGIEKTVEGQGQVNLLQLDMQSIQKSSTRPDGGYDSIRPFCQLDNFCTGPANQK